MKINFKKYVYGADGIYTTNKSIAVRKVSQTKNSFTDRTVYFPKTKENLKFAENIYGKLRKGRKNS